jgi:microcystin degradation protein MlrC
MLADGRYTVTSPNMRGMPVNMGRSACIVVGPPGTPADDLRQGLGIELVIAEERALQVYDPEPFRIHGIDVMHKKIVALKSSVHFRAAWEPIAHAIVTAAGRGLSNPDFTTFPFKNLRRPIYPFDTDTQATVETAGHAYL